MASKSVVVATLVALWSVPAVSAGPDDPQAVLGGANTPDGFELQWTVVGNATAVDSFTLHWSIDGDAYAEFLLPAGSRGWFIVANEEEGFMHEFRLTVHTRDGNVTVSNSAYVLNYPHCEPLGTESPFIFTGCLFPPPP